MYVSLRRPHERAASTGFRFKGLAKALMNNPGSRPGLLAMEAL